MTQTTSPSKYVVVKHPPLPATCVGCHKSANGVTDFVDFNTNVDYYGAILMCEDCFLECGRLLGLVPVAEVEDAARDYNDARETIDRLQDENVRINAALDSLFSLRPNFRTGSDSPGDTDEPNSDEGTGTESEAESGPSESLTE